MKKVLTEESLRKRASKEQNDHYVEVLSKMINCKTVFAESNENALEYARFYDVIEKEFPNISKNAERLTFGGGCFVYVIKGKNAKSSVMLMSHHDVVSASENWETPPFVATKKGDYLFGRGTIDTKTPLLSELQAVEELLAEGFDFNGVNVYIGSSNNEETCGDGMVLATKYFKENGIRFSVVLDEGGAITEGMIPGVSQKSALVAVHEKSRHVYKCTAKIDRKGHGGFGGNSDNAVERLSGFINEVSSKRNKIYKGSFSPEVKETFYRHAKYASFPMNLLYKNINLFAPIMKSVMMKIPAASAMLSTSVSFTTLQAGSEKDPQMRAKEAAATMFLRCVREDDLYKGLKKIEKIAKKYGVEIQEIERDYCKPSSFKCDAFKSVEKVLHENFPDVVVAPFLLTAGTDARRFTDVADEIFRFAPIDLSKSQFASVHSDNERIKIVNVGECVNFYKDYLKEICK